APDADREVLLDDGRAVAARVELDEHVLQPGLRAQQRAGVAVDEVVVLRVEVERDDRDAVADAHLADVPHPHAGDPHGLPLPGHDRLRGGELGLQVERLLLDQREAQPLVAEDVEANGEAEDDEPRDGEEVAQVTADGELHGRGTLLVSVGICPRVSARLVTEKRFSRPALRSRPRTRSAALPAARSCRASAAGLVVFTLKPSGGGAGVERRSGASWVSHGTSSRSGGRSRGLGGLTPSSGAVVSRKRSAPNG